MSLMIDSANLEQVVTQFRRQLRDFLRRRVSSEAVADDFLQEVWLKVSKNLSDLPSVREMDSWLYRIARNVLTDFYRRQRTTTELPDDLPAEPDDGTVTGLPANCFDFPERDMSRFIASNCHLLRIGALIRVGSLIRLRRKYVTARRP